jgi:hypothetical protein
MDALVAATSSEGVSGVEDSFAQEKKSTLKIISTENCREKGKNNLMLSYLFKRE